MRLYLDDDMASILLAKFLRQAGHHVQVPGDIGTTGIPDPAHLIHTIREQRVLVSGNHHDFEVLHDLILGGYSGGGDIPGRIFRYSE